MIVCFNASMRFVPATFAALLLCAAGCADGRTGPTDGGPASIDARMSDAPRPIGTDTGMPVVTPDTGAMSLPDATRDVGPCVASECTPGATDRSGGSCGNCGTRSRVCGADCTWGAFTCGGEGECAVGASESLSQACGACGSGTQSRSRTCGMDCRWGAYGAFGACGGASSECAPGATETRMQSCPGACGGTQQSIRSCDGASCRWGAWGPWGACSGGGGVCTPGATRACSNGDACGVERCSAACAWGSCEPRDAGGCLRIRPGTSGPAGNNYQCCPRGGGDFGWQFCLPTCAWSSACDATSAC